jgi:small conductance mechanosensitive channel
LLIFGQFASVGLSIASSRIDRRASFDNEQKFLGSIDMELLASFGDWLNPELVWPVLLSWGARIVAALLVFLVGRWIVSALVAVFGRTVARADVDETLVRFLSSLVRMTLLVFVVLTAIGVLGIPTANFLAIVGAAGLAVGLTLKDSLSNFSSGVMLVFFRPFKVGDFVEAGGIAGTINTVGIFNTIIKTGDNRVITVPNSLIYGNTITNYSAETTRRIDMTVGISYDDDIGRAKALMQGILSSDERVLESIAPTTGPRAATYSSGSRRRSSRTACRYRIRSRKCIYRAR